jgi:hypothetical protein
MAKLTNFGAASLASAAVDGEKIDFKKIKIGDGGGAIPVFNGSETALINEITEIDVTAVYRRTENPNYIYIEGVIPFDNGGYTVREALAVDEFGNAMVIGDYAEIYKPEDTSPHAREVLIRLVAVIENNINVINLFSFSGSSGGSVVSGGYPVGTIVDNYLAGNDAGYPAWVKLGKNVSADIRVYPKLIGLGSQGAMSFSVLPVNNMTTTRLNTGGAWHLCAWHLLNNLHILVARESGGATNHYRVFTSSDGIDFSEMATASALSSIANARVSLYYLNNKHFMLTPYGVFESSNNCASWIRRTTNSYTAMWFYGGIYIFGDATDKISTSSDLVSYVVRFTGTGGEISNFVEFNGRVYAFKYCVGLNYKISHSTNGVDWFELTIASYTHHVALGKNFGAVLDGRLLLLGVGLSRSFSSADGMNDWVRYDGISCTLDYGRGAVSAGDTLYSKECYSVFKDGVMSTRVTEGINYTPGASAGFGGFSASLDYIYYADVVTNGLSIYRYPLSENKNRVFLPNFANKMMKVL